MKGSILQLEKDKQKKHCRKWQLRVYVGDSKTKTRRITGTYTEAKDALEFFIRDLQKEELPKSTFKDYSERWLKMKRERDEIQYSTYRKYELCAKSMLPYIGDKELRDITPADINDLYVTLKTGGSIRGETLTGATMMDRHITIGQIFKEAEKEGLIEINPVAKIKAPKVDTPERKAITLEQIRELLSGLDKMGIDKYTIAVRIAVLSGVRRSEICGLQWGDIKNNCLNVERSIDEKGLNLKSPKTKNSIRTVAMPQSLIDSLAAWKVMQQKELEALGLKQTDKRHIVTSDDYGLMHPQRLSKWWFNNKKDLGCESISFHELRHSYSTMLIHAGVNPKTVQDMLGHSDPSITMKIYTHAQTDTKMAAAKTVDDLLAGSCKIVEFSA